MREERLSAPKNDSTRTCALALGSAPSWGLLYSKRRDAHFAKALLGADVRFAGMKPACSRRVLSSPC